MDLIFVHGWGSGSFIWKEMINDFQDNACHMINIGFIGTESITIPQEKFIGIGHSLGGLWLLKHYPERLAGFVSVASFNCFYQYIPQQILTSMQKNIVSDTKQQITEFWHHAGLDQPGGLEQINPAKLIEGLIWLSQWNVNIPDTVPIIALASHDDKIVPKKMTEAIWTPYDLRWNEEGGHMLPLTKAKWCTKHIKDFIDGL